MIEYVFGDDTLTARETIQEKSLKLQASIRWVAKEDAEREPLESLFDSGKGSLLGRVVVVLENPSSYSEEVREKILSLCEKEYSGNVFLWDKNVDKRLSFHKKIKQLVPSQETKQPFDEQGMVKWIASYAPDIPLDAVRVVASRVGFDVWAAKSELEKLAVLPSPVSASDVERVVALRDEVYGSAFPLLDAIMRKQKPLAVRMVGELLQGGASERFILSMLAYQFRLFLALRVGKGNGESVSSIHTKTGFHPVAIQKAMPMALRIPLDSIAEMLGKVAATEKSLITTTMDGKSIVTMLIISLCN